MLIDSWLFSLFVMNVMSADSRCEEHWNQLDCKNRLNLIKSQELCTHFRSSYQSVCLFIIDIILMLMLTITQDLQLNFWIILSIILRAKISALTKSTSNVLELISFTKFLANISIIEVKSWWRVYQHVILEECMRKTSYLWSQLDWVTRMCMCTY